jgi:hypothetical protein
MASRERREAMAKEGRTGGAEELPERFFRLPRIRFLLILCREVARITRWVCQGDGGVGGAVLE